MDKPEAVLKLAELVNPDQAPVLSEADLVACLDLSVIPDGVGRLPDHPGWQPGWDLDWAAAETCVLRHLRSAVLSANGQVTQIESEGSRFTITPSSTDWLATARVWRERSQIGKLIGYGKTTGFLNLPVPQVFLPGTDALQPFPQVQIGGVVSFAVYV